ncbi:hypothetical protein [Candidatus Magnetobacterium casense]|uniref:Uncharacterized protein n=1 Tax=Candidatus Magnetobacterium casense TaxID=1455061 RepID=A0ABS6S4V2_9BACT|nr:hypothetical protein [Candidatus Magnetobacterium casensis]MBV6343448.1 hypothetical protein [Candidatus Magnetobacterium casensis]
MRYRILVELEKTATNTNVLSGTELDSPPASGSLVLYAASTVNTATLEVPQAFHKPGVTALLRKRTDGIPNITDDPPFIIPVQKGTTPVLVLGGTTGTCHFTAILDFDA